MKQNNITKEEVDSYHRKWNNSCKSRLADKDLGDHQLAHRLISGVFHLPGDLLGPHQATTVVYLKIHLKDLVRRDICPEKLKGGVTWNLKLDHYF